VIYADVKNPTVQNSCKIYPNPANTELTVLRKNAQTEIIGVYNLVGSEVLKLNKFDTKVDISTIPSGMYILKMQTDHEEEAISFIKK
jgi:hypothetical protein